LLDTALVLKSKIINIVTYKVIRILQCLTFKLIDTYLVLTFKKRLCDVHVVRLLI